MSIPKSNRATLFFLLATFSIASFKLSYCIGNYNSINFCPEIEKQSLLSFKQSLKAPSNKLSSWNNGEVNCCKWKGVVCHNYTGHVHQLHLRHCDLHGRISSSLLNLKHLRYLDLSRNYFEETIPSFIGLFPSLEYLNLSNSGFYGIVPCTIGNLSNLRTLSLESYYTSVNVDSLEWLSGLSLLEHLNMNYVNLSRATSTNWMQVINTLSFLVELRFRFCSLNFVAPMNVVNVSSLAILDLSGNEFLSFVVPNFIFSELTYLDLSRNALEGPIPSISNTTKLQYIDLSFNYLNSTIPDWLYFCKDLEIVYLKRSFLDGTISNAIANLSSLNTLDLSWNEFSGKIPREITNLCKMKRLDLRSNIFQGELSNSFKNMSDCFLETLKILDLGSNKLSGHVPDQFGEFKRLRYLNLGGNKLTENLPKSLGQLFDLEFLAISKNMLEGEVTESHFFNLNKLKYFYASGNHLTLKVNPNWIPPFKLVGLGLGSWNLGISTQILSWLETQKKSIVALDLSSTRISGHVPNWFWKIQFLNLSHNHLHGKIPDINGPKEDRMIYLSSNQFSGSLPRVANTVTELDLSNNSFSGGISHFLCDMTNETHRLKILHLGKNKLTGELSDCWMKWPSLRVLNLENNMMFGSIPNSIGFLADLQSLNLKNNKFYGRIPSSIHNCTKLVKIDLSHNNLDGNIPAWMGKSLAKLRFLILRSNNLSGEVSSDICHLSSLHILDLSNNKFSGLIPKCFHNFIAMAAKRSIRTSDEYHLFREMDYSAYTGAFLESASISTKGSEYQYDTILSLVTNINLSNNNFSGKIPKELTSLVELQSLNLSGNHLKGSIPDRIGDMKQLESLDFSRNSLSGEIPNSFTTMSSLNHLNLSYNKLIGRIPESTQILGFDASSFIGNNLCGPPLTSNCSNDNEVSGVQLNKEDNEGNKFEIDWFDIFLSLGYAVGFSVVCTMLFFKKSWRDAYFGILEDLWNKAYVYFYIKWRRLTEY